MKIVVKVLLLNDKDEMLVLRRNPGHPNFPNHLDFPGGEVEDGESPLDAVHREIIEETGIILPFEDLSLAYEEFVSQDVKHILYKATAVSKLPTVKLSWEHQESLWIPLSDFTKMELPKGVDRYHLTMLKYLDIM